MIRKLYLSAEKGYHYADPICFRCGDCCVRCPAEVTQAEIDLIKSKLNEEQSKMFLASLTTDPKVADPIDKLQAPLSKGIAWIKAPCCFLDWEWKRKGGINFRSVCKIYDFRPEICRIFHCGKHSTDEPLLPSRYKYELTPQFREFFKAEIIKSLGEQSWKETERLIQEAERRK